MAEKKQKAIIFGASEGGKNFIKYQNEYEIIAIVDNNQKKQGTKIQDIRVISPVQINDYDYDVIVITSIYIHQINKQLTEQLNIKPSKIKLASKHQLKPSLYPFQDARTVQFAKKMLFTITEKFQEEKIRYFIDFGTLLGIVRDGDLISWDDDIDISIHPDDLHKAISLFENKIQFFNDVEKSVTWHCSVSYESEDKPIGIDLEMGHESEDMRKFSINFGLIYIVDDLAVQIMNHAPKHHFLREQYIQFEGHKLSVPYDYEQYLEYTYGDWRTPKKVTSYGDNTLTFREPTGVSKRVTLTSELN